MFREKPTTGIYDRISSLRKEIRKAEENDDEQLVKQLEDELYRLELGDEDEEYFDEEPPSPYEFFSDPFMQEDIAVFAKGVCEFIKNEKIPNVLLLDKAARPAWVAFDEYFKVKYPEEKPDFYFTNPNAFNPETKMPPVITLKDALNALLMKNPERDRLIALAEAEFVDVYRKLCADRDKPLLIFDTCSHTGETIKFTEAALKRIGFKDIRIITASLPDPDSKVKSQIDFSDHTHCTTCYPFGYYNDQIIKEDSSVLSKVADDDFDRENGILVRKEIRQIVRESLAKN